MSQSIFKVNRNIEIEIKHGLYAGRYNSRIEEVSDDTIEIAIPSKQGHLLPLPEQTWFLGKLVDSTCLYLFKAKIIRVAIKQNVPTWIVEKPKELEKTQRRCYIRVDARIPVEMKVLLDEDGELKIGDKKYTSKDLAAKSWTVNTKDISGSGAKIISKLFVPEGTNIAIALSLPDVGSFCTTGKVVRSEVADPELGIYWLCVHFTDLTERERDKVIRFVFKQQLEMRKRNLL